MRRVCGNNASSFTATIASVYGAAGVTIELGVIFPERVDVITLTQPLNWE